MFADYRNDARRGAGVLMSARPRARIYTLVSREMRIIHRLSDIQPSNTPENCAIVHRGDPSEIRILLRVNTRRYSRADEHVNEELSHRRIYPILLRDND